MNGPTTSHNGAPRATVRRVDEDMPDLTPDLGEDGWAIFDGDLLPGWEGHKVSVLLGRVNGVPRVVGVRVEPKPNVPVSRQVLTTARLRRVPLAALAPVVWELHNPLPDLSNIVGALDTADEVLSDQRTRKGRRRATTPEAVAQVYAAAGKAPREAVCKTLHISPRTADRYISEARRLGYLPDPQDSGTQGASRSQEGSEK